MWKEYYQMDLLCDFNVKKLATNLRILRENNTNKNDLTYTFDNLIKLEMYFHTDFYRHLEYFSFQQFSDRMIAFFFFLSRVKKASV